MGKELTTNRGMIESV